MTKKDEILKKLCLKAATKQAVYRTTKEVFEDLKVVLKEIAEDLDGQLCIIDKHVQVEYKDKGEFEAELRFSGDVLIFHFHSNTFHFDKSHRYDAGCCPCGVCVRGLLQFLGGRRLYFFITYSYTCETEELV